MNDYGKAFTLLLKGLWNFITGSWLLFLSLVIGFGFTQVIQDNGFSGFIVLDKNKISIGLNMGRIWILLIASLVGAIVAYIIKTKDINKEKNTELEKLRQEKEAEIKALNESIHEVRKELDSQYSYAFTYSSFATFQIHELFATDQPDVISYLKNKVLYSLAEVTQFILEANEIDDSKFLSASLYVKDPPSEKILSICRLKFLCIGPEKPELPNVDLNFYETPEDINNNKFLPGAASSFHDGKLTYIDDASPQIYQEIFHSDIVKSFIAIPINENEKDGNVFAILIINSPNLNQFQNKEFISDKIYPALKPLIALIKVLHKLGDI